METVNIIIEMEDGGVMKGELYPEIAPISVENFLKLIDQDFFAGLIFHRVIPGFMIQGGGYDKDFNHHEADSIKGEFRSNGVANDLLHTRGVLSMARTMVPDSASSQFFIMHADAPHLDGDYAAFGKITEGLEVVDQIANAPRNIQDCPNQPIVIKTIKRGLVLSDATKLGLPFSLLLIILLCILYIFFRFCSFTRSNSLSLYKSTF